MSKLLEIREILKSFYKKYDRAINGLGKFMLAFCVFYFVTYNSNYVAHVNQPIVFAVLAAVCAFLPASAITGIMCGLLILNFFAASVEVGIVTLLLLGVMFLLYFSFKPKSSILMAAAVLLCTWNCSGILAISVGLLCTPLSMIPVSFGIITYGMISVLRGDYSVLSSQSGKMTSFQKIVYFLERVMQDKRIILLLIAMLVTILVVYLIRILPMAYSWSIAIAAGTGVYALSILLGNFFYGISVNTMTLLVTLILAAFLAVLIHFFSFFLDPSRTEYVEFEDDDYYYYVRAVPKVRVAAAQKQVVNITKKEEEEDWEPETAGGIQKANDQGEAEQSGSV